MDLLLIPIFFLLFFTLILLVYLVPLDLTFTGCYGGQENGIRMTIAWGFVGVRSTWKGRGPHFEILVAGRRILNWEGKEVRKVRRPTPEKKEGFRILPLLNALPILWPKIQKILIITRESVRLRKLNWMMEFGSGDPVMTGMLYGFFCAVVLPILPYGSGVSVRVKPVFDREIIDIKLELILRLHRPLRSFVHAAALLLRKDTLDAIKTLSPGGVQ